MEIYEKKYAYKFSITYNIKTEKNKDSKMKQK